MELPLYTAGGEPTQTETEARDDDGLCEYSHPRELVDWALQRFAGQRMLTTTAFGMEGCALIDMISQAGGSVEVVYLDTHFFFPETHTLRERLQAKYPNLVFTNGGTPLTPDEQAKLHGPELWKTNPDLCCKIRKVDPMREVMQNRDVWFTALRRSQSAARASLQVIQWDWKFHVLKFSPFAHWERSDVWNYIQANQVPFNELHLKDYPTIGCTHCTKPVPGSTPDSYSRAGRWEGTEKTECGLHDGAGI